MTEKYDKITHENMTNRTLRYEYDYYRMITHQHIDRNDCWLKPIKQCSLNTWDRTRRRSRHGHYGHGYNNFRCAMAANGFCHRTLSITLTQTSIFAFIIHVSWNRYQMRTCDKFAIWTSQHAILCDCIVSVSPFRSRLAYTGCTKKINFRWFLQRVRIACNVDRSNS